ncbi:MAG: oligosaccharide flippase family protein, partial [Candidatus Falkowbacteria bacterium]|nr:oligosaccharide flippase family protein [Candidatus Falkowbacteria bacterium]
MFNFFKNSFILITGNLLAGLLGYVFHLIISRLLSVSEYGELQSLVSLISILAVPSAAISYFTIKHSAAYYAKNDYLGNFAFYKWLRTKIYKIILGLTLLFLASMPLLRAYLHLNNYYNLIFTWLIVIIGLFISLKTGILSGWQDFKKLSLNSALNAIFKLLIGITMVYIFASVPAALGGFLAAGVFSFFFLQKIIKKKAKANFNIYKTAGSNEKFDRKKIFSEIKKVIWPILFFTFLISLFNSLDM